VYLLHVANWLLARLVSHPSGWLWIALSLAAGPLVHVLAPVGVLPGAGESSRLAYQVALLAGLSGAMLALAPLADNDWLLRLTGGPRRVVAQWAGVAIGAGLGSALGLLGCMPLLWHGETPWMPLIIALLLATLHLAALGGMVLQLPATRPARVLALPVLAWVLPSFLGSSSPIAGRLAAVLQVGRELEVLRDPSTPVLIASIAPIIVLGLGVLMISGLPPRPIAPNNEIRRPR